MPWRPTEKTERIRLDDREALLRAARELVTRGGFAAATVAKVAARAGLSTGSVYRHFPSREALLGELFAQVAAREMEATRAGAVGEGTAERLSSGIRIFADRALRSRRLAFALLAEPLAPRIEEERLRYRRAWRDLFAEILKEGVARGELPALDVAVCAAALVGAIGEALVGPLAPGGSRSRARKHLPALIRFSLCAVALSPKEVRRVA